MDLNTSANLLLFYAIIPFTFNIYLASYSYAYYVYKNGSSIDIRTKFQSNLTKPSKWLFAGEKPLIERILLNGKYRRLTIEEYFNKITLFEIQLRRILCILVNSFAMIIMVIGAYFVQEKHLIFQYVLFLIISVAILAACISFGHKLNQFDKTL